MATVVEMHLESLEHTEARQRNSPTTDPSECGSQPADIGLIVVEEHCLLPQTGAPRTQVRGARDDRLDTERS